VAVSPAHGLGRFNGRLFDNAQKFQTQFNFHQNSRSLGFFGSGARSDTVAARGTART
jgi:hypothetical protein